MEEIKSSAAPGAKVDDPERSKLVRNRLMLAAALASVAVVPYTYPIIKAVARAEQPASELVSSLASNAIIETLVSWGLIALGLRLRRLLGLGLTLLNDWSPADDEARRRVRNTVTLAVVLGLGLGVILAIANHYFEPLMTNPQRAVPTPPAWTGLLASVGAGIQEEIWLRLGIMTSAVWIGTQIVRRTPRLGGRLDGEFTGGCVVRCAAHSPGGLRARVQRPARGIRAPGKRGAGFGVRLALLAPWPGGSDDLPLCSGSCAQGRLAAIGNGLTPLAGRSSRSGSSTIALDHVHQAHVDTLATRRLMTMHGQRQVPTRLQPLDGRWAHL